MPTPCATCDHPQVREINHRLREGLPLTDISRWLDEKGPPITRQALSRHAKGHLGVLVPHGGRRGATGRLLEYTVEMVEEALDNGSIVPTLKDGMKAIEIMDARAAKSKDQDLLVRISMILTGNIPVAALADPEVQVIEGEFRQLLSGD